MTTLTHSTQQTAPINQMVVFGDSLSDMGTVFRATGGLYPPNPPYFQGRYSNGRVWVEYLADRLSLSTQQISNFACGGATTGITGDSSNAPVNAFVPGLLAQVQTFTHQQQTLNQDALYVLWAGANDYLQGTADASEPVENITKAINSLTQKGAKRLLIANLPDLGQLPATRYTANANTLSNLTKAHNQSLRRSLKVLHQQHNHVKIATLDANSLYQQAIVKPSQFGFTNVTAACWVGSGVCGHPDQFLFWDAIHPTHVAHRILGETAFAELERKPSILFQAATN